MHLRSLLPGQISTLETPKGFALLAGLILCAAASPARAIVINTTNISDYLLVGLGQQAVVGTSTAASNFCLRVASCAARAAFWASE